MAKRASTSWFHRFTRGGVVIARAVALLTLALTAPMPATAAPVPGTPAGAIAPLGAEDVGFAPPVAAITHGGSLTMANLDTVGHNLVCDQLDPATRRPICRSDIVGTGGTGAITGVSALPPGTYGLHCQPHPQMTFELTVVDTP